MEIFWHKLCFYQVLLKYNKYTFQTTRGLHLVIRNTEDNHAVMKNATVEVADGTHIYHVDNQGHLNLYLSPGSFVITIRCHGYATQIHVRIL